MTALARRGRVPREALSRRAVLVLLLTLWCVALLVAGVGCWATYGEWCGAGDWPGSTLLLAVIALPGSLGTLFGIPLGPITRAGVVLWAVFWSLAIVLQAMALITGRRRYLALLATLLLPASWLWTVYAAGLMGI